VGRSVVEAGAGSARPAIFGEGSFELFDASERGSDHDCQSRPIDGERNPGSEVIARED